VLLKVKVKVAFGARLPLSKTPPSLVTECAEESLLVQVTVVPAFTGNIAGEKAKLARVIELPDAGGEDVVEEVVPYPDEHADRETRANIINMADINGNNRRTVLFILALPCIFGIFVNALLKVL
jgi:hypothetical protein